MDPCRVEWYADSESSHHDNGGEPATGPDRAGRRSDTLHLLSYQVGAIAVLYTMPESVTGWSDERKDNYSLAEWWDNVRHPKLDNDDLFINYVLHPYWGAAYYVRARERRFDRRSAFVYSALMSAAYEFGAEALFERPSIQDLISTPLGGWFVGEYFMDVRAGINERRERTGAGRWYDRSVLVLTDPVGAINRRVDSWLGRDTEFALLPYIARVPAPVCTLCRGARSDSSVAERQFGVRFRFRW